MKSEKSIGSYKVNRRIYVFSICLIISTLFWFLIALSKDYNSTIVVPVKYSNLPKDKILINPLPQQFLLEVNSFGFNLLKYRLGHKSDPIVIDVSQIRSLGRNKGYLVTNTRLDRIVKQLENNIRINRILPDTVYFVFDKKESKTVPVKFNSSLNFEKQFQLTDTVQIVPYNIQISGAKSIIDSINYVETETLKTANLNKDLNKKIILYKGGRYKGLEFSTDKVQIKIPIEKYTEANVSVLVQVINLPPDYTIKTFPDKITVSSMVSLKDFDKINPAMFQVVGDYNQISEGKKNKMKLTVSEAPDFVKSIRIEPDKVEYILMKQ